ncbi:MAG: anion permease [Akkermansia sp.]|nr:anion permease [Akkermansia sp.]
MNDIIFCGLTLPAWITLATVVTMFSLLLFTKLEADIVFVGGMTTLLVTGTLPTKDVLAGFSSPSVVVVGVLFVVVAGMVHTGVLQWIVKHILGTPRSYSGAVTRLMLPVAVLSSVLSNTTVVALFINVVKMWSRKLGIAPSRLLIPLSYASGMGGICTLIGTPPNLIISTFYQEETGVELSIFTPTLAGLFCLAVGIISVIAMQKLLPEHPSAENSFESVSDYTVELLVPADNEHIGSTISECGLGRIKGGKLVEIIRFDREIISPVKDDEFVLGGDRLIYAGNIENILQLRETHRLVNSTSPVYTSETISKGRKLHTAYVNFHSKLIGTRMGDTNYEAENDMVLVAVARQGERIAAGPHEIELQAGDTLLLESSGEKQPDVGRDLQFFDSDIIPRIGIRTLVSTLIMLGMILLSAFKIMPLLSACFLAAMAMLITRCCNIKQAHKSINWEVLLVFAGSVCLGTAIEKTGLATILADGLLNVCGTNPLVVLLCICLLGTFITEFISNAAAGAMFFPIAYNSALTLGVNPLTFCVALMIAVSSSFATPIGSPTHMLVYGPGGYRFSDFMRIGIPMNFIIVLADIFIVTLLFPL